MAGWTNRGKYDALALWARTTSPVTSTFYLALIKSTPTADTNTMSDVTQIATGNGYNDGGLSVSRNTTDFDVLTEDDTNDLAYVQLKDFSWSASGGPIPSDSNGATYCVLTDDNATVANRDIFHYGSLSSARVVSSGQTLTLQNFEIRLTET